MRNAVLLILSLVTANNLSYAGIGNSKSKVQEITFSDMDIKGNARTPDGAYLVQRRGLRFMPLYQVKQNFDNRIRESLVHMK